MKQSDSRPARQRGAALVVGLIFLAMLSLMGVAAYMVANQEERMSGNARDRIRAFEAAEASLRDCEALLDATNPLPDSSFNGSNGLYAAASFDQTQVYEAVDWLDDTKVRKLQVAGADAVPDVAFQPRCIIERIGNIPGSCRGCEQSMPTLVPEETVYRITATGYGANRSTAVNLQSTFRRP